MYLGIVFLPPEVASDHADPDVIDARPPSRSVTTSQSAPDTTHPPSLAQTLSTYQLAATAEPSELDALLRDAARQPTLPARRLLVQALLMRYAELDTDAALRRARALGIELELLLPLYQRWIFADPDGALAALRRLEDRGEAQAVALAMLRARGEDEQIASRVLAALPEVDRAPVRADAVLASAARHPAAALREALAFDRHELGYALVQRVGAVWARSDPASALSAQDSIGDNGLRMAYQRMVLATWMRTDPEAALLHLASVEPASQQFFELSSMAASLEAVSPQRLIDLAQYLTPSAATRLRHMALQRMAADDPAQAIALADRLAGSKTQRDDMYSAIASTYGRNQPEAAFAWARRMNNPRVAEAVLGGVAQHDPHRALDFALSFDAGLEHWAPFNSIFYNMAGGTDMASVAQRLLALDDMELGRNAMQSLVDRWITTNTSEALSWLFARADSIDPNAFGQLAQQAANQNLALAISYTSRVPEESIESWTTAIARRYANADPQGAMRWILERRGQPGYEASVRTLVDYVAPHDLAGVTNLVADLDGASAHARGAVATLTYYWIREDLNAAIDWVNALRDPVLKGSAAEALVGEWARRDPLSAGSWTLGLPHGDTRDKALGSLWSVAALSGEPDRTLLEAFSSVESRSRAILGSLHSLLMNDEDAARRVVATYVTDPAMRAQAEQLLDEQARSGDSMAR